VVSLTPISPATSSALSSSFSNGRAMLSHSAPSSASLPFAYCVLYFLTFNYFIWL
jgi:hypothetical protein